MLYSGAGLAGGLVTAVTASPPRSCFMDVSMVASSPQLLPKFIGVPFAGASLHFKTLLSFFYLELCASAVLELPLFLWVQN